MLLAAQGCRCCWEVLAVGVRPLQTAWIPVAYACGDWTHKGQVLEVIHQKPALTRVSWARAGGCIIPGMSLQAFHRKPCTGRALSCRNQLHAYTLQRLIRPARGCNQMAQSESNQWDCEGDAVVQSMEQSAIDIAKQGRQRSLKILWLLTSLLAATIS